MAVLALSFHALAGERVVCAITLPTDGGVASTADQIGSTGCSSSVLQSDGGVLGTDGGYVLPDGGLSGCNACALKGARSIALQCDNPVNYSERWDGGANAWGEKGVTPATTSDMLIDFDINPDPYRIDFRGTGNQNISIRSVSVSANVCRVGIIQRHAP
jgi:hypothetical protein